VTVPGEGSPTPNPPSASLPLPEETATPAAVAAPLPSPNLAEDRTLASGSAKMLIPVTGKIIRGYEKDKTDGIDIAAQAGAPVRAAADGVVAAITRNTDQVPILVIRHPDNLLTVYANIDDIKVNKDDKITRGQAIATVRGTGNSFLHFEVRRGIDSVDPVPFLN
jgi:murein DD-endopeptidase MepM/ murein hydrolase activator NlpD